jgi:hypothetical protein
MKFSIVFIQLVMCLVDVVFSETEGQITNHKKLLVQSNQLRRVLTGSGLTRHALAISNGNRSFGSKAHNATVNYIKEKLDSTGYYNTELQTFPCMYSEGKSEFMAAGKAYDTAWFTYGPSGNVTAEIVPVANLGCERVKFHSSFQNAITSHQKLIFE